MPASNRPEPVAVPYHSLDYARRTGSDSVELHCLACAHIATLPVLPLIHRLGAATLLVEVGRRARCRRCGRRGCHVQPQPPPAPGEAGYREFLGAEMLRCQRFVVWAREQLHPLPPRRPRPAPHRRRVTHRWACLPRPPKPWRVAFETVQLIEVESG